jgi:hypothetical protein
MRHAILMLLAVIGAAGEAAPQLKDGDLVFTVTLTSPTTVSYVAYVDPANPSTVKVFSTAPAGKTITGIRMDVDNRDMVVGWNSASGLGNLAWATSHQGISHWGLPAGNIGGFELDDESKWVVSLSSCNSWWSTYFLCGVDSQFFPTLYVSGTGLLHGMFADVAIDRDPGCSPYVVGTTSPSESGSLMTADRQNNLKTIGSYKFLVESLELHPRSGDYLATFSFPFPAPIPPGGIGLISKTGKMTGLNHGRATAARITQDDHVWLIGGGSPSLTITKFDLSQNATVKTIPLNVAPTAASMTGIEIYGYRKLACTGTYVYPGFVQKKIQLQSRKPGDGNKTYALACSRARRPGVLLGNGEWLDLDTTDPLFKVSALDLAPSIFQDFRGTTDSNGNATAYVNIPSTLPANNGITIFVAGVIYDATGVQTVTNTHWFVL